MQIINYVIHLLRIRIAGNKNRHVTPYFLFNSCHLVEKEGLPS